MAEKRVPKAAGGVMVDGLYGASQYHLSVFEGLTDLHRELIPFAVRLPLSGFVHAQVLHSRIIITTSQTPKERHRYARLFQKAVSAVIAGGWLYEFLGKVQVGKPWRELTADEQSEIREQYVDVYPHMDNVEGWCWWKAELANLPKVREALTERR